MDLSYEGAPNRGPLLIPTTFCPHPVSPRPEERGFREYNLKALRDLLTGLREQNFEVMTLSSLHEIWYAQKEAAARSVLRRHSSTSIGSLGSLKLTPEAKHFPSEPPRSQASDASPSSLRRPETPSTDSGLDSGGSPVGFRRPEGDLRVALKDALKDGDNLAARAESLKAVRASGDGSPDSWRVTFHKA